MPPAGTPAPAVIDAALAKLDAILARAGAAPAPAAAAAAKPAPAPSEASSSSSRPGSSAALAAAGAGAPAGAATPGARGVLTAKARICIARITSAEPLASSAKLLKLQADLGGGDCRQIMAGLQQYVAAPTLVGGLVCVVANLKPVKLAGERSEAMVLAAEVAGPDGGLVVRTLVPPEGSQPGDLVHLDGAAPPGEYPKVLKLDEWRSVVPGLAVRGGKATFDGTPLVSRAGLVTCDVPDGAEIH